MILCNPLSKVPRPGVTIHKEPAAQNFRTNSTVTLTCLATLDSSISTDTYFNSMEVVQLTWEGPRDDIALEGVVNMDKQTGPGLTYSSNITITDIQRQDGGVYKCNVRILGEMNILGVNATGSITIEIFGKGHPSQGWPQPYIVPCESFILPN